MIRIFAMTIIALGSLSPLRVALAAEAPAATSGAAPARAASADIVSGGREFVRSMADSGINFLSDDRLSEAQRKAEFRKLLRSSYDMPTIGRFALGVYWRTATKAQQTEYQKLFENMIVDIYSRRFGDYNGQRLEVLSARKETATDVIVTSLIVPKESGQEKIKVDWRVRSKNGQYKVIDVIVEGVSMALTQRSDFASVIQRGGGNVNVLLELLRKGDLSRQASAKQASK